jgi:hypothetical protein
VSLIKIKDNGGEDTRRPAHTWFRRLQCVTKVSERFVEFMAQGTPCELLSPSRVNVDVGSVTM